jgi:heme/copper-type cytochrome/quinol oxidase subunit 4
MTSPRLERRETMTYLVGYGLALLLTLAAFGLVTPCSGWAWRKYWCISAAFCTST